MKVGDGHFLTQEQKDIRSQLWSRPWRNDLSEWESDFIQNILTHEKLSAKQSQTLENIFSRVVFGEYDDLPDDFNW